MSDLPSTAVAAVLVEQHRPLVVDEIELPRALAHGQVLVAVHASGICGSQLGEIDGVKGPDAHLPHLLGHEGVGTVEAVGPGVRTVAPGDRVVLHWRPGAGIDADPATYRWRGAALNAGRVTTFADRTIVAENRVTTIPASVPDRVAPLLGCAVPTGFGVIENDAAIRAGESIVVLGAGGVGLSVVQAAARHSAAPIVAVDLHDGRLELARKLGATATVNAGDVDIASAVRSLLPGGADVCIENTGNVGLIELAPDLVGPEGRVVFVGVPPHGSRVPIATLPLHFGKRLVGSHGGEAEPARDIPRFVRLLEHGRLDLESLVTATWALADINDAIAAMRDGSLVGRCLVRCGGG